MALITCPECGKEFSDKATACPNCGAPNELLKEQTAPSQGTLPSSQSLDDRYRSSKPDGNPQNSKLAITAFVFSLLSIIIYPFSLVALILVIVELAVNGKNKNRKKGFLIAASVIALIVLLFGATTTSSDQNATTTETEAVTESEFPNEENSEIAPTETLSQSETETPFETVSESESETTSEPPVVSTETKEEFIATCQNISYKDLLRTPDEYTGQRIIITAKIQQVLQGGWLDDNQYYRVQTDNDGYDWYFDDEYFMYDYRIDDTTKLLQDDILKIYAEFAGLETVERALTGVKEEVPAIKAYYIEIVGE